MGSSCSWGETTGNLRRAVGLIGQESGPHFGRGDLCLNEGRRQIGAPRQGTGLSDFEGVVDAEYRRR